jgi:hypothetical protein
MINLFFILDGKASFLVIVIFWAVLRTHACVILWVQTKAYDALSSVQ